MSISRTLSPAVKKEFDKVLQEDHEPLKIRRRPHQVGIKLLEGFECVRQYNDVFVHEVTELWNVNGYFTLMLVEKHLTIIKTNRYRVQKTEKVEEFEPMIVFNLKTDIGKVFIKEETIGEKISDLFLKIDIDFRGVPQLQPQLLHGRRKTGTGETTFSQALAGDIECRQRNERRDQ